MKTMKAVLLDKVTEKKKRLTEQTGTGYHCFCSGIRPFFYFQGLYHYCHMGNREALWKLHRESPG